MSTDKSLKSKDTLGRHRNVLTRAERINVMKDGEIWKEDSSAFGLPKVSHRKVSVGKKDKVKKGETTDGDEAKTEETKA